HSNWAQLRKHRKQKKNHQLPNLLPGYFTHPVPPLLYRSCPRGSATKQERPVRSLSGCGAVLADMDRIRFSARPCCGCQLVGLIKGRSNARMVSSLPQKFATAKN